MNNNDLMSLLESNSPFYYHIITYLVSFISLCASFEAGLIHSLGTLTLTDIDHVRIIKSSVFPTPKRGGITGQSDPKHSSVHGNWTSPDRYIGSIGSKTRRHKETHTWHAGQSHLMRVTWTSSCHDPNESWVAPTLNLLVERTNKSKPQHVPVNQL